MLQDSQGESIKFATKSHALILRGSDSRGIYSQGFDSESGQLYLDRESTLEFPIPNVRGAVDVFPVKSGRYAFDSVDVRLNEAEATRKPINPFTENVLSLALNLGVSSGLWYLGRWDGLFDKVTSMDDETMVDSDVVGTILAGLFERLSKPSTSESNQVMLEHCVKIKCYEVFGDQVRDLLSTSSLDSTSATPAGLRVREHATNGTFVAGASERICTTAEDAYLTLQLAFQRRLLLVVSDSINNSNLSTKHVSCKIPGDTVMGKVLGFVGNTIITLEVQQTVAYNRLPHVVDWTNVFLRRTATIQINLLAGVEALTFKPAKNENIALITAADFSRLKVDGGGNIEFMSGFDALPVPINQLAAGAKAMTALSRVLTAQQQNLIALRTDTNPTAIVSSELSKLVHVPYRESTLTRVLQPMLEGRYVNYVLCCLDEDSELTGAAAATAAYSLRLVMELRVGVVSRVTPNEEREEYVPGVSEVVDQWVEVEAAAAAAQSTGSPGGSSELCAGKCDDDPHCMRQVESDSSAFWNLLHSHRVNSQDNESIASLEALQRERDRLLRSLDGILVREYDPNRKSLAGVYAGCEGDEGCDCAGDAGGALVAVGGSRADLVSDDLASSTTSANNDFQYGIPSPIEPEGVSSISGDNIMGIKTTSELLVKASPPISPQVSRHSGSSSASKLLPPVLPTSVKKPGMVVAVAAPHNRKVTSPAKSSGSGGVGALQSVVVVRSLDSSDVGVSKRGGVLEGGAGGKGRSMKNNSSAKHTKAAAVLSPVRVNSTKPVAAAVVTTSETSESGQLVLGHIQASKRVLSEKSASKTSKSFAGDGGGSVSGGFTSSPARMLTGPKRISPSQLPPQPQQQPYQQRMDKQDVESSLVVRFPSLLGVASHSLLDAEPAAVVMVTPPLLLDAHSAFLDGVVVVEEESAAAAPQFRGAQQTSSPNFTAVLTPERSGRICPGGLNTPPSAGPGTEISSGAIESDRSTGATTDSKGACEVPVSPIRSVAVMPMSTPPSGTSVSAHFLPSIKNTEHLSQSADESSPPLQQQHHLAGSIAQQLFGSPVMQSSAVNAGLTAGCSVRAKDAPVERRRAAMDTTADGNDGSNKPDRQIHHTNRTNGTISMGGAGGDRSAGGAGSATDDQDAAGAHLSDLEAQFLRAVSLTNLNMMAQCIRIGVNVHVKNSFGRDAIQIAARNGSVEALTLLHTHGAPLTSRGPRGDTLYHLAAGNGHLLVLQWLSENIYRGAGLAGDCVDMFGQTAAHVAARRGEVDVLKYLYYTPNVDVMQEDFDGRTPLECIPKQYLGGSGEGLANCREFLISLLNP